MQSPNLFLLILALVALTSCAPSDSPVSIGCDKLTSREEAENVMIQLNDDGLTDSSRIVDNLIGEWGLIGTVPGWVGFETAQNCFKLTISSDLIELEDLNSGNTSSSEWELKKFEANGFTSFYLETNEDVWNNRMGMQVFSEKMMFGSGRVDDGTTYIYEKLN